MPLLRDELPQDICRPLGTWQRPFHLPAARRLHHANTGWRPNPTGIWGLLGIGRNRRRVRTHARVRVPTSASAASNTRPQHPPQAQLWTLLRTAQMGVGALPASTQRCVCSPWRLAAEFSEGSLPGVQQWKCRGINKQQGGVDNLFRQSEQGGLHGALPSHASTPACARCRLPRIVMRQPRGKHS